MSCHCFSNPCQCGAALEVECADPGLDTTGRHLAIFDNEFCLKRIANTNGFLWYGDNGWRVSAAPQVILGELEIAEDVPFGDLVLSSAGNGLLRRVVPAAGANGVITALNGQFVITDPAEATIPDPLTVTEINATTINVNDMNVAGTSTFSGLATDTITQVIGLNASNELVAGTTQTISVASFYEINDLAGSGTPNWTYPGGASSNVQIGNEISDADSIAHVVGTDTVEIDVAGSYTIEWRGTYSGYNPNSGNSAGTPYYPGLWLTINSTVVDKGLREGYQDRNVSCTAYGKYNAVSLSAGDQIRLRGNGSMRGNGETGRGTGLQGVGLILTKYK